MKMIKNKVILLIGLVFTVLSTALIFCFCFGALPSSHLNESQKLPKAEQKTPYVFGPLSALRTKDSRITNEVNENITFKGVMIPDPSVLYSTNRLNRGFFEEIKNTGVNIIRIPVHPDLWFREERYLDTYLVPAVKWAHELNLYVIIDWHYIGNIVTGRIAGTPPADRTVLEITENFWRVITERFADNPGVIFELCNEPADISAQQWYGAAEKLIKIIRLHSAEQLVIVGGIQYAQDLSWVAEDADNRCQYRVCFTYISCPRKGKLGPLVRLGFSEQAGYHERNGDIWMKTERQLIRNISLATKKHTAFLF